ncbi:hypothetical protein SGLAM104S_02894 [Streptomyces glaucescens]
MSDLRAFRSPRAPDRVYSPDAERESASVATTREVMDGISVHSACRSRQPGRVCEATSSQKVR